MIEVENANTKTIIAVVAITVLLIFFVYFFFFRNTETIIVFDEFGNPVAAQIIGQDLINILADLETITFDDSVFRNPAFTELSDQSVVLRKEPMGKSNPFSPFAGVAGSR